MFQEASRLKLRFTSNKGDISVEDLWDLPLTSATGKINLDDLAKAVNRELKSTAEESFVAKETKGNELLKLKLELLKIVIGVKLAENEAVSKARENAAKKQEIMAIINQKKGEQLAGSSLEDLEKMLATL